MRYGEPNCHLLQAFRASYPDLFLCRFLYVTRRPVVENFPIANFRYPSSHLIWSRYMDGHHSPTAESLVLGHPNR